MGPRTCESLLDARLSLRLFLLLLVLMCDPVNSTLLTSDANARSFEQFNWSSIIANRSLRFHHCYEGFECAMLLVPLDWAAKEERHFASIAVIRLPAIVAEGDPRHGGTIITNPGGPGGSGVLDLLVNGRHVRDVVDGDKHFDIVSFDPRGTSFSRPPAKCFGDQLIRSTFAFQQRTTGSLNEGPSTLKRRLALAAAFGKVCYESSLDPGPSDDHILSQMSTAVVARDMLEIIDQLNEQAATSLPAPHESAQRPLRPHDSGPALLQYIGFSYGTHLGNTFASVYPERVQSMVLDGVVDSIDYSQGVRNRLCFVRTCITLTGRRCGQKIFSIVKKLSTISTRVATPQTLTARFIGPVTPEQTRFKLVWSISSPRCRRDRCRCPMLELQL